MPTALRDGPYRLFFYATDREEPAHIHVERESKVAKLWLAPVRLANSGGFNRAEIADVHRVVARHQREIQEAWDDYFGG